MGDHNDGFILLWKIDNRGNATLHASNKCTAAIRCLGWLGGSIVTLGTRHVKAWRRHYESGVSSTRQILREDSIEPTTPGSGSKPRPLIGRNCLLGPVAEATFTCMCPISDLLAIVCSDDGKVCLLKEDGQSSTISLIVSVPFYVTCCAFESETHQLWIGGMKGENRLFSSSQNVTLSAEAKYELIPWDTRLETGRMSGFVAGGVLSGSLVTVADDHMISIYQSLSSHNPAKSKAVQNLPSHRCAVSGVLILPGACGSAAGFLTWSTDGTIMIWSVNGILQQSQSIQLDKTPGKDVMVRSELRVLRLIASETIFVSGDSAGVVRVTENMYKDRRGPSEYSLPGTPTLVSRATQSSIQVHESEITAIASVQRHAEETIIAMGSRDRTVQIFRFAHATLELLQTITDHSSSITDVLFLRDGDNLITSSSDRTVMIHTLAKSAALVFIQRRIISFKSTPISISAPATDGDHLFLISCADKRNHKCSSLYGHQEESIRPHDRNGESVLLSQVSVHKFGNQGQIAVMIGVSGIEKALRIHDYHSGAELFCENTHVGGVSSYAYVRNEEQHDKFEHLLVTTGFDSTVNFWSLQERQNDFREEHHLPNPPSPTKPLRKVLPWTPTAPKPLDVRVAHSLPPSPTKVKVPTKFYEKKEFSDLHPIKQGMKGEQEEYRKTIQSHDYAPTIPTSPGPLSSLHDPQSTPEQQSSFTMTVDIYNANLDAEAQELSSRVCAFRKKMQLPYYMSDETNNNLRNELSLAMNSLSGSPSVPADSGEEDIDHVLNCYSKRLKKLVEDKVSAAASSKQVQQGCRRPIS